VHGNKFPISLCLHHQFVPGFSLFFFLVFIDSISPLIQSIVNEWLDCLQHRSGDKTETDN